MAQNTQSAKVVPINIGHHRAACEARRNELVLAHMDLVQTIAYAIAKGLPPCFDVEDLISIGYLALLKAARSYRPQAHNGTPFAAYARPWIRGAMKEAARRGPYREATRPPLSQFPEPASRPRLDVDIDEERSSERLNAAVASLPVRQQNVIRWHYEDELRMQDCETRLGDVGKSMVSRLHTKSIRELRSQLAVV